MDKAYTLLRLASLGLLFAVALPLDLLAEGKGSMALQANDPIGIILTITAVSVVFTALALLVLLFKLIGRVMLALSSKTNEARELDDQQVSLARAEGKESNEIAVAISLALAMEQKQGVSDEVAIAIALSLEDSMSYQHDQESYRLTIRPRQTQWNHKAQSLRKYPF